MISEEYQAATALCAQKTQFEERIESLRAEENAILHNISVLRKTQDRSSTISALEHVMSENKELSKALNVQRSFANKLMEDYNDLQREVLASKSASALSVSDLGQRKSDLSRSVDKDHDASHRSQPKVPNIQYDEFGPGSLQSSVVDNTMSSSTMSQRPGDVSRAFNRSNVQHSSTPKNVSFDLLTDNIQSALQYNASLGAHSSVQSRHVASSTASTPKSHHPMPSDAPPARPLYTSTPHVPLASRRDYDVQSLSDSVALSDIGTDRLSLERQRQMLNGMLGRRGNDPRNTK
jgi:uncharacterized membrane-anchored protein YhcB (DUF1043 family)